MFEYYYRDASDGGLNFAVARIGGEIAGVCGYIKASGGERPDIWISYILAQKGSALSLGFRLLEFIRLITTCRTIACNNIRRNTAGLYEFLGWRVADMTHYYRLNKEIKKYTLCNIRRRNIQKVLIGGVTLDRITDKKELGFFELEAFAQNKPYKDRAYIEKRYFDNPWLQYEVYAARENGNTRALLVIRFFRQGGASAIRVVDYVGDRGGVARCGAALDRIIRERGADFCDWFAFGLDDGAMKAAGFTPITGGDPNVVPLYLSPPVMENTGITVFVSDPDGYAMFRADGDQDRPNLGG
jgi:hypothetical protein